MHINILIGSVTYLWTPIFVIISLVKSFLVFEICIYLWIWNFEYIIYWKEQLYQNVTTEEDDSGFYGLADDARTAAMSLFGRCEVAWTKDGQVVDQTNPNYYITRLASTHTLTILKVCFAKYIIISEDL